MRNCTACSRGDACDEADTNNTLWHQPEGPGLEAVAEGFRHLGLAGEHAMLRAEHGIYDAHYTYCQAMVAQGKLEGAFKA